MKQTSDKNIKASISEASGKSCTYALAGTALTMFVTAAVALAELAFAISRYKEGMNLFDFAFLANGDYVPYCFLLLTVNLISLPFAVVLYRSRGISLKNEIYEKETLLRDILLGVACLAVSFIVDALYYFVPSSSMEKASPDKPSVYVLMILTLVFVSGINKEIYFRGIAKSFVGPIVGETAALVLFNIMFGVLDWYNLGYSFFSGLVWIFFYKKSKHLITPMIAHGGANLLYIIGLLLA